MGNSRLTGWRRRVAAHMVNAERIADFLVTREGEQDYATGVIDAIEYVYLILAYEEKDNDHTFDNSDIRPPALLARFAKYEQEARAERIAEQNNEALGKLAGTEVAKDDTGDGGDKKST